jgi:hypothetical protein
MTTYTVTNLNDSGLGSLRAEMLAANADPSVTPAIIDFTVNGTITLTSALPEVSRNVQLDGTSAPGYVSGGPPVVEINCNNNAGLVLAAGSDGSRLLGMAVDNASGNGVTLNAGSITLDGNYIGLNLAGVAFGNGGDGVYVSSGSSNNLIGLNPSHASDYVSNIISGNAGNGLSFHGSSGNTVVANRIGTDAAGGSAIANGENGIWVTAGSNSNEIGGTEFVDAATGDVNDPTGNKGSVAPVFVVPPLGNLVSGNNQNGILIDSNSQNNVLNGNFVGTAADGNSAIGNAADGVLISGADNNSLVGCQFVNNPFVYYNVVSGNGANGLQVTNSNNVIVQGNFFGIGANNTNIVANQADGILVDGSSQNTTVGGVIPLGNVSAGNGMNGIEVRDTVSGFVTFNTFGGLLAFKGAAPNGNDGLLITSTGGNNTVRTNVFSGNANNGIEIAGDASGVTVDPNIAGLNTAGNAVLPNLNNGLQIGGTAHDNTIGGNTNSVIPQNTFSGNDGYGVAVVGQAYNNQIFNSFIGSSATGINALGNLLGGVLVGGSANNILIGGTNTDPSAPTSNLISGNTGNGVTLLSGTDDIRVIGNAIGADRFGASLLPNSGDAIVVEDGVSATLTGSAGAVVLAGSGSLVYTGAVGTQTVTGAGTSTISLPAGSASFVVLGTGNDTILSSGSGTLAGGGGGNIFNLLNADASTSNWVVSNTTNTDTILAAEGNTTVAAYGAGISIQGGSGALVVGGSPTGNVTVNAASGSATVWGGGLQNVVDGGSGALLFVGLSGSTATVNGGSGAVTIFGASGDNLFYSNPSSVGGAVMAAYGGNEMLNASASNAAVTLASGMGNATLIGGFANDLLIGGSGNSLITMGAGADSVDFYQGNAGGTNILADFGSSDLLILTNYGASAAASALAGATVEKAGMTITLPDQTKITFLGVSSLNSSQIVSF